MIDGTFRIDRNKEDGTTVTVEFPLRRE